MSCIGVATGTSESAYSQRHGSSCARFSKGSPLISGKSRLVKYYNLARLMYVNQWNFEVV